MIINSIPSILYILIPKKGTADGAGPADKSPFESVLTDSPLASWWDRSARLTQFSVKAQESPKSGRAPGSAWQLLNLFPTWAWASFMCDMCGNRFALLTLIVFLLSRATCYSSTHIPVFSWCSTTAGRCWDRSSSLKYAWQLCFIENNHRALEVVPGHSLRFVFSVQWNTWHRTFRHLSATENFITKVRFSLILPAFHQFE